MTTAKSRISGLALVSLFFCGAAANCQTQPLCPNYLQGSGTWLINGVTNMANQLTSGASPSGVSYVVQGGSFTFPQISTPPTSCNKGGPSNPDPASCYGTYWLPPRNGGPLQQIYMLDPDEAVLFIGLAPPSPYYYGFQTYVFQRYDDFAQTYLSAPVTPYASVGPAINQMTANEVNPRTPSIPLRTASQPLQPVFGGQMAVISTANKRATSDIESALPYFWAPANQPAAQNIANLEMFPVSPGASMDLGYMQLGSSSPGDRLQTVLRLTPTKSLSAGLWVFDDPDVAYIQHPPACVLRISPRTPIFSPTTYSNSDDIMPPMSTISEDTLFGQAETQSGLPAPPAPTLEQELETIQQNVIAYWTSQQVNGQNLQLQVPPGHTSLGGWTMTGSFIWDPGPGATSWVDRLGRNCINVFEYLLAENPSLVPSSNSCQADSPDGDYFSTFIPPSSTNPVAYSQVPLTKTGVVVLVGINHGTPGLGSATYSNISLQTNGLGVSLDNAQLAAGSAAQANSAYQFEDSTYVQPVPALSQDFYVATFTALNRPASLIGNGYGYQQLTLSSTTCLLFDERDYLDPTTGTKRPYVDPDNATINLTTPAVLLWFDVSTPPSCQSEDAPASLTKTAGEGQNSALGQTFGTPLQITVRDAVGNPISGVPVMFAVVAGGSGASATFASFPSMPILTDANGNGTAPTLTANGIAGSFTVTATVNSLSVTFTLGNLVAPTLGADAVTVGSAAGSGSVLLSAGGPWTASSNASWLQLSAGSTSGTGNALIQFTYGANPNPGAQTGTLTIAGLTFSVMQLGAGFLPVTVANTLVISGLNNPQGVAVDASGNVYIADTANNAVKEWSVSSLQVSTLVSSGLSHPAAVAVDANGNVYIADSGNHAIEKFTTSNQQLTSLVSGLSNPSGVALDRLGNVYFSDTSNNVIQQWNATTQQLSTLENSGLNNPAGVAVDAQGNVCSADSGNASIKEWMAANGMVTLLVPSGLNQPTGVAVDGQGNVYFADTGNNAIKQWNRATQQVSALVSTGLDSPMGLAVDRQGNVYVADTNDNAIQELSKAYLFISAGSLTEPSKAGTASFSYQVMPANTAVTATSNQPWLTITSTAGGTISFSFLPNISGISRSAQITVLGQTVTVTQSADPANIIKTAGDSQTSAAGQAFPIPLAVQVTDGNGIAIPGVAVTFTVTPGINGSSGAFASSPAMPIITDINGNAIAPTLTANQIGGTFTVTASVNALSATFTLTNPTYTLAASSTTVGSAAGPGSVLLLSNGPWTASSNASWLQLSAGSTSGTGNALIQFSYAANLNTIPQTGTLTIAGLTYTVTQAGTSYLPSIGFTPLVTTGLNHPQGVALDAVGNVYIADSGNNAIKEWNTGTRQVTTLVSSGLNDPAGVVVDSQGNVYIADEKNNAIKEWNVGTGMVTPVVSLGISAPIGLALDSQGNLYFSDAGHNAVDERTAVPQKVTTLVLSGLNVPADVTVDAQGNVYFADLKNNAIKQWNATTKVVSTLVAGLSSPFGVAVDGGGNVYFTDSGNNAIKQWSPATGQVTALVSTGLGGPRGLDIDTAGNLYVADYNHSAIKKYTPEYLSLSAGSLTEGAAAGTDSIIYQVLPAGAAVTATSNRSWLTITGSANGAISFSFLANLTIISRTAQITVSGLTVTVTQSADLPVNLIKMAGGGQSTKVGTAFATPLQVAVTDAGGNPVQGVAVTFTAVPGTGGASGTFSSSLPMPILTNTAGKAIAPTLTANSAAGSFSVTVTAGTSTVIFGATVTN